MKKIVTLLLISFTLTSNSQTEFKVMFYNLLNYPTAPPNNRSLILKNILNNYEPDLFMVCELENNDASNEILSVSLSEINKNYSKAQFITNQSNTFGDTHLQQLIYYNNNYFILDNQSIILTNIRDINHYSFILNTPNYLTNPIYLEVFVTHLKASQGNTNIQKRLEMVTEFTNYLDNLPVNSNVIFAGDFNFYTTSESGYQKILNNNNNIIMKDMLNLNNNLQNWHNHISYANIHTQATRLSNSAFNNYGAGGGLDDRFDFIMLSENITNNSNINYINNTYKSFGNNSNCYNRRIDDSNCNGFYNQNLRSNLYNMSDHLPVVLSLESSQTLNTNNATLNKNYIKIINGNLIKNEITIYSSSELINTKFSVFNSIGQIVYSNKLNNSITNINISLLDKGIYYIKFENIKQNLKFIVIK